jgi:hypothetical protein
MDARLKTVDLYMNVPFAGPVITQGHPARTLGIDNHTPIEAL